MKVFTIDGHAFKASRQGLTPEKLVEMDGSWPVERVKAIRQYFVDGERQRYWPLGWDEEVDSLEDGDRFVIELGDKIKKPSR